MLMTFKENILYQQILLDYFTNKIKDENVLSQKLKDKGLETGFVYRKVAYMTLSVAGTVFELEREISLQELLKAVIECYSDHEVMALPLYYSVNEIKLCILSINDITFEKNLKDKNKQAADTLKSLLEVRPEVCVKGVFATLKELKLNICSLMFENFPKPKSDSQLILRAKLYIEKNYMNKLSLSEVSKHLGITSYYFCRVFKKETGINFANYLTEVRLDQAKKLLKETKLSNRVICEKIGINSTNYFHQLFKNYTGMTPNEFKRS